jgi:hypothetical protein
MPDQIGALLNSSGILTLATETDKMSRFYRTKDLYSFIRPPEFFLRFIGIAQVCRRLSSELMRFSLWSKWRRHLWPHFPSFQAMNWSERSAAVP